MNQGFTTVGWIIQWLMTREQGEERLVGSLEVVCFWEETHEPYLLWLSLYLAKAGWRS